MILPIVELFKMGKLNMFSPLIIEDIYKLLTNKSIPTNTNIKIKFFNLANTDITNTIFSNSVFSFDTNYWSVNNNSVTNSQILNFGTTFQSINSLVYLKLYKDDNTEIISIPYNLITIANSTYVLDINTFNLQLTSVKLTLANVVLKYLFGKNVSSFSNLYLQIFDIDNNEVLVSRYLLDSNNWSGLYRNILGQSQFDYELENDIELVANSNIFTQLSFRLYDDFNSEIIEGKFYNNFYIDDNKVVLSDRSICIVFEGSELVKDSLSSVREWGSIDMNSWLNLAKTP